MHVGMQASLAAALSPGSKQHQQEQQLQQPKLGPLERALSDLSTQQSSAQRQQQQQHSFAQRESTASQDGQGMPAQLPRSASSRGAAEVPVAGMRFVPAAGSSRRGTAAANAAEGGGAAREMGGEEGAAGKETVGKERQPSFAQRESTPLADALQQLLEDGEAPAGVQNAASEAVPPQSKAEHDAEAGNAAGRQPSGSGACVRVLAFFIVKLEWVCVCTCLRVHACVAQCEAMGVGSCLRDSCLNSPEACWRHGPWCMGYACHAS